MLAFGDFGGVLEIFFFLFMFAAILFLAYITTRIVAKKSGIRAKSKYMEVVDRLDFGADKQLFILRAGDEFFLVSKTSKGIDMLTKVALDYSGAYAEAQATPDGEKMDFRALLEKHLKFGMVKADSKESVFRKNIGKIRNLSDGKTNKYTGEGENTDREA